MEALKNKFREWQRQSRDQAFLVRAVLVVLAGFGLAGILMRGIADVEDGYTIRLADILVIVNSDPESDEPRFQFKPHGENLEWRIHAFEKLEQARAARDWRGVIYWVVRLDLKDLASPLLLLSLVAGGVWAIIAAQFAGFSRSQLALYGVALLLGFVSATLTLVVVELQAIRGFTEGNDFASRMIFWIAGVGLREEALKLLCFTPLLPFLRGRGEIDALVCGAMVGLGFAIQENVNYYMSNGVTDAFGRMLTANFLHMALTAFAARALFRMMLSPKRHWEECLGTFIAVVILHGLYDAFPSVPELEGFALASFIILAVLAFRYCSLAGSIGRIGRNLALSPMAVFVVGTAVLTGCVYLFSCMLVPFPEAAVICGEALIQLFPIAAIFVYKLHEH